LTEHVLLVEPKYYTKYPPLGLLKLSSYRKSLGDTTELVRGNTLDVSAEPNKIYITSLFTWAWKPVWEAVRFYLKHFPASELWLGGLYASLLPQHAALSGVAPTHIFKGIFTEVEDLLPDYSLVPEWNKRVSGSIVFSSRGCIRSCPYCAVPLIEGSMNSIKHSIKRLIWPGHKRVIFFDNNFLASPTWRKILDEVEELDLRSDFNQGLDARLVTEEVANRISRLKIDRFVRLSYDYAQMRLYVRNAIELLKSQGINGRNILVYTLYNFTDDPDDFYTRVRDILEWGAVCYPQRYEPNQALYKNQYVSPKWDATRLNAVQRARRVIGNHGAFLPHKGMLTVKVQKCFTFDAAFNEFMEPLEEMIQ
jgi:hypothetical protein